MHWGGADHHSGKQKVQEGRQGVEEETEEKGREMQVELVDLRVRASLGAWEEEWGTLCCLGGEEEGQAGSGGQEVGGNQGYSHLPQVANTCRG